MDTTLQTFKVAQGRAEYLYKLAEGLVNTRKRGMRQDWARSFKKMMGWKTDAVIDRVDGRDAVVVLRHDSHLSANDFDSKAVSDLYRAALVMAVSAMDAYFHAKVLRYVVEQSKKQEPSESLMNHKITVSDFVRGNTMKRRNSALRSAIARQLSFQSFQQPKDIKQACNLIGVIDIWNKLADKLSADKDDIQKTIKGIVDRRNKIAHEGDVSQSVKARNAHREIQPKMVKDALVLITNVVEAADDIINAEVR